MAQTLEKLESEALQLSLPEREKLIHRLIVSLESEADDTPEAIAQAWDEEIARRVADMEAGRTEWVPFDEVMTKLRDKINAARIASSKS